MAKSIDNAKPRIGIIGAGRLGTALARLSLAHGYEVRVSNSQGPESLGLMMKILLPGVIPASTDELVTDSDIIILAIPFTRHVNLPQDLFSGKIVIDAMNHWEPTEGPLDENQDIRQGTSEYIARYFRSSTVVKTLNHVAYSELEQHSLPHGHTSRRAIAIAADDETAKAVVTSYIDNIGFDPVDTGKLKDGMLFQPDTPLFNARLNAPEMRKLIANATV